MNKIFLLSVLFVSNFVFSCHCLTFEEAKKTAIKENKFIVLEYGYEFNYYQSELISIQTTNEIEKKIKYDYVYLCSQDQNFYTKYIKKYNLLSYQKLLIIDANGYLVFKFDKENEDQILAVLQNLTIPKNHFQKDFENFAAKKTFSTAFRISQHFLDLSLLTDNYLKEGLIAISREYFAIAQKKVKKVDIENYSKKLELFELVLLAHEYKFEDVDKKLGDLVLNNQDATNLNVLYFLKYTVSKALKKQDLTLLEDEIKTIMDFDYFKNKSDLLLSRFETKI